jgi:hypothetical protein
VVWGTRMLEASFTLQDLTVDMHSHSTSKGCQAIPKLTKLAQLASCAVRCCCNPIIFDTSCCLYPRKRWFWLCCL